VDALTTILGFGALMVASHKGLESLGRVLTLGVTTCTFTSLVLLPAILALLRPAGGARAAADAEEDADAVDAEHEPAAAATGRRAAA